MWHSSGVSLQVLRTLAFHNRELLVDHYSELIPSLCSLLSAGSGPTKLATERTLARVLCVSLHESTAGHLSGQNLCCSDPVYNSRGHSSGRPSTMRCCFILESLDVLQVSEGHGAAQAYLAVPGPGVITARSILSETYLRRLAKLPLDDAEDKSFH